MRLTALTFCLYLFWMACLPCTDKVLEASEHHPNLVDVADTPGHSPFHDDTCPVFCSCGCCATYTVTVEPEKYEFTLFQIPQSKPLVYPQAQVSSVAQSFWRPPRQIV